jgi:hypothetical protein
MMPCQPGRPNGRWPERILGFLGWRAKGNLHKTQVPAHLRTLMHRIMMCLVVGMLSLAGCVDDAGDTTDIPADPDGQGTAEDVLVQPTFINFTGRLSNLPAGSAGLTDTVQVLPNTGRITATLLWADEVADLAFELTANSAYGDGHKGGAYDAPGSGTVIADIPEPERGNWTFVISGANAVRVDWTLVIFMAPDDAVTTVLSESFVLASGAFFEINTQMPFNGTLHWDWSIDEGSMSAFNVHTHFDDEAQYLVEETTSAHAGKVLAEREGGYSLMWENSGAPQTITYRAWGDFTVDSYFPPR